MEEAYEFDVEVNDHTYTVSIVADFDIEDVGGDSYEHFGSRGQTSSYKSLEFTGYQIEEISDAEYKYTPEEIHPDVIEAIAQHVKRSEEKWVEDLTERIN